MDCSCDYDVSTVWSETKHKARKEYRCTECNGHIRKGEHYTRIGSLFDGRWTTYRQCEDCKVTICDLGQATRSAGGCFCYAACGLMEDMMHLAHSCDANEAKLIKPIFASFNAASKERGGRQLSMNVFELWEEE